MKRLITGFLFISFCSCSPEEEKVRIPEGVLPMDSVAAVLRDIHELESSLMVVSIRQDTAQNLYRMLEPEIFQKHRLDTGRFNRSLRFYASNPFLLDSLYHVVLRKTDSSAVFKP
jgi:hypothetical protein